MQMSSSAERLTVEVHFRPNADELADDVRTGLSSEPKTLPPKYLYDEKGSELFDQICNTEEYYPTRTEEKLLVACADDVVRTVQPTDIVELGSGAARKTRVILDAADRNAIEPRYVPFDVSESMLRESSAGLIEEYDWLNVHGIVGDYGQHLDKIPNSERRLFMFIGSTIGNLPQPEAVEFLGNVAEQMGEGDRLLLGTDLVKDHEVLNSAYNDSEGLTAAFNENVLEVINRELDANFDVDRFEHEAFFNAERSRIEMHLRSKEQQSVDVGDLDMTVQFDEGETILTEISRKFTKERVASLLADAGLDMTRWYTPNNDYFGLSLSKVAP